MELPLDPMMLLSFINMKLRDFYPTLDILCDDMNIDRTELEKKLNESTSPNQFNTQSVEKTPRIGSLNDQKKKESNKKVEKKVEKRKMQKEKKYLSDFIPVDQKLFVISLGGSLID